LRYSFFWLLFSFRKGSGIALTERNAVRMAMAISCRPSCLIRIFGIEFIEMVWYYEMAAEFIFHEGQFDPEIDELQRREYPIGRIGDLLILEILCFDQGSPGKDEVDELSDLFHGKRSEIIDEIIGKSSNRAGWYRCLMSAA
jgi:hypothetical protein